MSPSSCLSSVPDRESRLSALREEVRRIEDSGRRRKRDILPFGLPGIDERLAGGGLAVAALHEVAPAAPTLNDDAAATLFTASIAARLASNGGMVLWVMARRDLFAPGLALAGLPPQRLICAECRRDEEVLAVMEDGLRHGGLAAVVGEAALLRLPASRRLQLAAEDKGTSALLIRRWRRAASDPFHFPAASVTRWRIACLPSERQSEPTVGRPRWQVMLVRQRGGDPHMWTMEAPDAEARLALSALPGDRSDPARRRAA